MFDYLFPLALVACVLSYFYLALRPQPHDRRVERRCAEINRQLAELEGSLPARPACPPTTRTPEPPPPAGESPLRDYREEVRRAWLLAMESDQTVVLTFPISGAPSEVSNPLTAGSERGGVLQLRGCYPGFVRSTGQQVVKVFYPAAPPGSPYSAYDLMNQCVAEIEEEERPVEFKVFESPCSTVMAPEPAEATRPYAKYLRQTAAG